MQQKYVQYSIFIIAKKNRTKKNIKYNGTIVPHVLNITYIRYLISNNDVITIRAFSSMHGSSAIRK